MALTPPTLLSIIAYARSGALEHAWRLFEDGGYDGITEDAAVLSVRGRLLKDRALSASGSERQRFYRESAGAYARAGEIGGATYPLINAATLSLLAGDREQARALARNVLDRLAEHHDDEETPYYRAATRAEALLLLGEVDAAKTEFARAISLAPRAYEDHASTLRQFRLILETLGQDGQWLDAHRPPRCLHFAGHMAPRNGGTIKKRIAEFIVEERIGFGFGALAAGADILVAETLLEQGAELHVVLPAAIDVFREACVAPFGTDWAPRYDHILEHAQSVRSVSCENPLSALSLQLAAEVAMGSTASQAETLTTEAVQLLILEQRATPVPRPGSSEWIGRKWAESRRRQQSLNVSRANVTDGALASAAPGELLAALLYVSPLDSDDQFAVNVLPTLAQALRARPQPLFSPRWTNPGFVAAYQSPADATAAAQSLAWALDVSPSFRVACHYAIIRQTGDPFGKEPLLIGPALRVLADIASSTPPGAIHVTENFAAALAAGPAYTRPRTEFVGELSLRASDPIRLFSLRP